MNYKAGVCSTFLRNHVHRRYMCWIMILSKNWTA